MQQYGAPISPLDYVLLFDIGSTVKKAYGPHVPRCHLLHKDYAGWYLSGQDIIPVVPRDVVKDKNGMLRPVPLISMTKAFADLGTSLKHVPHFDTRLMKLYRDLMVDMYTGKLLEPGEATNDHVIPISRGWEGRTRWENNVTTAGPVNWRKGDRTPEECGLELKLMPWRPSFEDIAWLRTYVETGEMDKGLLKGTPHDEVYRAVELHQKAVKDSMSRAA
jgi:hypothetical protein